MSDDLVKILRKKAREERNVLGDLWGNHICDKAADLIDQQAARIAALEADVAFLRRRRGELVLQRDEERRGRRANWAAWQEAEAQLATEQAQQATRIAALEAERDEARSTLSAWFDLSKKGEDAGADILRDALETWLRRACSGGMPVRRADIVRTVLDEAARLYLWQALVPVLRTIKDDRIAALEEGLRDLRQMIADGAEDADPLLVIDALLGDTNG